MLKLVALLLLVRVLVPSFLTTWAALEMKPDSSTVPTMGLVIITVYILRMLVSFAVETVSLCKEYVQFFDNYNFSQLSATMAVSGLEEALLLMLVEWRSVLMRPGAQCVMTSGAPLMLE